MGFEPQTLVERHNLTGAAEPDTTPPYAVWNMFTHHARRTPVLRRFAIQVRRREQRERATNKIPSELSAASEATAP